ncbi:MAG: hydroxymethylbilane synthase [Bacillota bacterium]|nr:hydroxymethylbilane synthase [Bacillota bacterium]
MQITIGSRGSNLALIQTKHVKKLLEERFPQVQVDIKIIHTTGDKILDREISKIGDKGVFVKEIERALIDGEIDLAVHSMKDMPGKSPEGLVFANPPKGEDPRDILVAKDKIESLDQMEGFLIGTGSARRKMQLERLLKNIQTQPIRGNIETRMGKIESENLDGVILAKAGLLRAGYQDRISYTFSPREIIPSPCQGILALQYREDSQVIKFLAEISDPFTTLRYQTERAYQKELDADCHSPIGLYSSFTRSTCKILACFGDGEKNILVRREIEGDINKRVDLARRLADQVKEAVYEQGNR